VSERGAQGPGTLDVARARQRFDRAGAGYDSAAVLQMQVLQELLARLEITALQPRLIVDAGAGTGPGARALKQRFRRARVIAIDFSTGMLRAAAARRSWLRPVDLVCANACRLPLADAGVDLVFSNFLLHWCDPDALFAECRRVLAPRGLLSFTCLGPDTLRELREAWRAVDSAPHVHPFFDMHDLGDALVRAGFAGPVLDVERYTLEYADLSALLADLRTTGARNSLPDRPKGLSGKSKLPALAAAYESWRRQGRLPATFEVIYGQAWAPTGALRRAAAPAAISLAELRATLPGQKRS
jgi:malonyl-CoA O-methyltransferase